MNDYSNVIKINAKSNKHDGNNNRTMAATPTTKTPQTTASRMTEPPLIPSTTPVPATLTTPATTPTPTTTPATTTTKVRKSYSINQIDLSLLKNELDEYIDRELRLTNFGKNTLAQRRYQFENGLQKVSNNEPVSV